MMAEKKPPRTVVVAPPIWMVSFGDTVALMLAFFVMLFAMSSLEDSNVARLIAALSTQKSSSIIKRPVPNTNYSIESLHVYQGISIPYIEQLLKSKIEEVYALRNLEVAVQGNEILLILPEEIFGDRLGLTISEDGQQILYELGLILATINNAILIEGYSPLRKARPEDATFSNRWELRLMRAANVAQAIRDGGLLRSTKVFGWSEKLAYGESPALNLTEEEDNSDIRVALRITSIAGGQ